MEMNKSLINYIVSLTLCCEALRLALNSYQEIKSRGSIAAGVQFCNRFTVTTSNSFQIQFRLRDTFFFNFFFAKELSVVLFLLPINFLGNFSVCLILPTKCVPLVPSLRAFCRFIL